MFGWIVKWFKKEKCRSIYDGMPFKELYCTCGIQLKPPHHLLLCHRCRTGILGRKEW